MTDYTKDAAYAAMCLWEEIVAPELPDAGAPWADMRESLGTAEFRSTILDLGEACDAAWMRAWERFEESMRSWRFRKADCEAKGIPFLDEPPDEPGGFDWEFVPTWIRLCVDWTGTTPRVKGS